MADAAQEVGLARAWSSATGFARNAGEMEAVMALAIILPLGALALGFCRGRKLREGEEPETRGRSMSFASGFMAVGSWPTDIKFPPPIINAVLYFDKAPQQAALEETCAKILTYDNFRSLPKRTPKRLFPPALSHRFEWYDIEVNPADMIHRVRVTGSAEVQQEIDRVMEYPLRQTTDDGDRKLPLWDMHVIENVDSAEDEGLGSVIVLRVHHTIGDGMSLIAASRRVVDAHNGEGGSKATEGYGDIRASSALPMGFRPENRRRFFDKYSIGQIVSGFLEVAMHEHSGPDTPLPFGHYEAPTSNGGSRAGFPEGTNGGKGIKRRNKRGAFSGRRRIVVFPDVPLSLVKKVKDAAGVTVNDVIMSLISGCIRRYCDAQGTTDVFERKGFRSRALIPVALPRTLRAEDTSSLLCNRWAFVSMSLDVDETDALKRLQKIHDTTMAAKRGPLPVLQYILQSYILPYLPLFKCREMVRNSLGTHTVTVSNVPGPQEPVSFAKQQLRRIHMAFRNAMPQVGVVSLNGMISTNFVVDPVSIPDCDTLPTLFLAELKALAKQLGVLNEPLAAELLARTEEQNVRLNKFAVRAHA